jgi:hypothetical protein
MNKTRGRPAVPKNQFKGVLVGARFSSAEAARVAEAAKKAKQKKSEWIRKTLLDAST